MVYLEFIGKGIQKELKKLAFEAKLGTRVHVLKN